MSLCRFAASMCCLVSGLLAPQIAYARAEQQDRPWEVEAFVGGIRSSHPNDGVATLPPPGEPFLTFADLPSRRVSSWIFGDGAALLNQVNALRPPVGASRAGVSPLDPVLTSASISRQNGVAAGVRVRRAINARFGAELSIDYGSGRFAFTPAARSQFETTRASVVATLAQVAVPLRTTVTSEVSLSELGGPMVIATGALNINLKRSGRVIPYVVGGAGVVSHTGGTPSGLVHTTYTIQSLNPAGLSAVTAAR